MKENSLFWVRISKISDFLSDNLYDESALNRVEGDPLIELCDKLKKSKFVEIETKKIPGFGNKNKTQSKASTIRTSEYCSWKSLSRATSW